MSLFESFLNSPMTTILFLGFRVKDFFADIGVPSFGWFLCIIIELVIFVSIFSLFAWLYEKIKKIYRSFKS